MRDFEEEDKGEGLLMGTGFLLGVMTKIWKEIVVMAAHLYVIVRNDTEPYTFR